MKPKIIKTESEYDEALEHISTLMNLPQSHERDDEIELFTSLIEKYEDEHYPVDLPDPIDAIRFVMEQQQLTQKDLVSVLGSASRVSEVLNRKRPLSIAMMRALHDELGIPAEILLQDTLVHEVPAKKYDLSRYPFRDMVHLGYFQGYEKVREAKLYFEKVLDDLFSVFPSGSPDVLYCRQGESKNQANRNALLAWQAHILHRVKGHNPCTFNRDRLDDEFFSALLEFSQYSHGPLLVEEYLASYGILFVTETHLPGTYIDGAAFISGDKTPVVALTLRYDRVDNFWFTLVHELAHIKLHLESNSKAFFDAIDGNERWPAEGPEAEADALAREMLFPAKEVESLLAHSRVTNDLIYQYASRLKRNPALIAGRLRWESGDYSRYTDMIRSAKIRHLFH